MAIKLLLVEDVEDLGRSGEIVNVKPGFARNFLLPQKLAVIADKGTLRMQARLQEERNKRAILDKQEAEKTASALEGVTLSTIVKVDHEGRMYGSVSSHDIVQLLQDQAGIVLEKRAITLKHAIKETGDFEIGVKLKEGISGAVTLKVVPEETKQSQEREKASG
jgi:large subunit ribosomal protein L9